ELGGEGVVDDHLWIGSVHDRTEREFGLPRHPDLADQHDVERGVESLGDLKTDRHAAARQGEYNWILLPQLLQPRGELGACRSPIGKHGSTELPEASGFSRVAPDSCSWHRRGCSRLCPPEP